MRVRSAEANQPGKRLSYEQRLAQLVVNETPTPAEQLTQSVLDFGGNHLVFSGLDMNLTRIYARDFAEGNRFGQLMGELIETTSEAPITVQHFNTRPDRFKGFLLTDRNREAAPIGHIFQRLHTSWIGFGPTIQPLYITVHPVYQQRKLSKALRLTLLQDSLVEHPQENQCDGILVMPYEGADDRIYPLFKELDPGLVSLDPKKPKTAYTMNPDTVRGNLPGQFAKLGIQLSD